MATSKDIMLQENHLTDTQMRNTETYKRCKQLQNENCNARKAFLIINDEELASKDGLLRGQLGLIHRYVFNGLSLSAVMQPDEIDLYKEINETLEYSTRFYFLLKHFGLRRKCIHTLLGDSGHGKSSLLRSIILDSAVDKNVLVYLSEEDIIQYQTHLNVSAPAKYKEPQKAKDTLSRIKLISQNDIKFPSNNEVNYFQKLLEGHIEKNNIELLVIDNYTTSLFSDMQIYVQGQALSVLKAIANNYNIPVIILVHPTKGALQYNKELNQDLIRGTSRLKNISDYIYCLQKLGRLKPVKSFVKTDKSRNHPKANETYFLLNFEEIAESFGHISADQEVSREYITEIININSKK